jgi:ribosomal protein L22
LCSLESVFAYKGGEDLVKANLPGYRNRLEITAPSGDYKLFLKRFINPPLKEQLKNWFSHKRRISMAAGEVKPAIELKEAKVNVPEVVAFGQVWKGIAEEKSFIITRQVPDSVSLETTLPGCFYKGGQVPKTAKKEFIKDLAEVIKDFHNRGFMHRDLYLSHIFYNQQKKIFTLIDLARCFKPLLLKRRYLLKDIAQLYYSAPYGVVSKSDRLRFYLYYTEKRKLSFMDKQFISRVKAKAGKMSRHDKKRDKEPPFKKPEK